QSAAWHGIHLQARSASSSSVKRPAMRPFRQYRNGLQQLRNRVKNRLALYRYACKLLRKSRGQRSYSKLDRITAPGYNQMSMENISSGPQIRVLVADDEENQRAGLAKMIQSWGFGVDTAADGQEAYEKLGQSPVHVLVTDLMMPRMDGFELLKRLGSQGTLPPTIVLTAFGNIETAVQTMHDLGAFWFLEKPIQPSALKVLL